MNYFMVNVSGRNGYSFMVTTTDNNIDDSEVISRCQDKELFYNTEDAYYAEVDDLVTDYDKKAFEHATYDID